MRITVILCLVILSLPNFTYGGFVFQRLYSFSGTNGVRPLCALVEKGNGEFYGTTEMGGNLGEGAIFKMSAEAMRPNVLVSSNGTTSPLVKGEDGDFYDTTFGGGSDFGGSIFKMTPQGRLTNLFFFALTNGYYPNGLLLGKDGNFYGTTDSGGENHYGTVFKFNPKDSTLADLYSFNGQDGRNPEAGVVQDIDGNLYGTTELGAGTIFKMAPDGTLLWSFSFGGTNGFGPVGELVEGKDGNFYGLTAYGGTNFPDMNMGGTVFKVTPDGALTNIYYFSDIVNNKEFVTGPNDDGSGPCSVILGKDGYLYGATMGGGEHGAGTIFKMSTNGSLLTLYSFGTTTNEDGNPTDGAWAKYLMQASGGDLYGTAFCGGDSDNVGNGGFGTVFKLSRVKPDIKVTYPTSGTVIPSRTFAISGTVEGEDVTQVVYQLDDGVHWGTFLNHSKVWSVNVKLPFGSNTVRAYAIDSNGDVSRTITVRFVVWP